MENAALPKHWPSALPWVPYHDLCAPSIQTGGQTGGAEGQLGIGDAERRERADGRALSTPSLA
jgi:hypothetical protein